MSSKATSGFWKFDFQQSPVRNSGRTDAARADSASGLIKRDSPGTNTSPIKIGRSAAWRYGISLLFVTAAFVCTLLIQRFFPYPFLFLFFAAVMASAWFGRTSGGMFAVLVSTILVDYYFVRPYKSFAINATDVTYFAGFVACAIVASWVSASQRKSEEALEEARDELEIRVAERTADLKKSNADLRRTMDEHEQAQQALRQTQSELAHLSRALTMGELTSSIAHEINQPLTAVVAHGHACAGWLSADPPEIEKARQTVNRIIQDGTRAGHVLGRIRALFSKQAHSSDWLDINEVILELTVFLRDEANRQRVILTADLAPDLPRLRGDRVQLQQVVLNLMMNALDAMRSMPGDRRELTVRSRHEGPDGIRVSVEDSGVGLTPEVERKIFDPFFTTKSQGIGMGLSISRSIIEAHNGKLWAAARADGGAAFQFTLPLSGPNENQ